MLKSMTGYARKVHIAPEGRYIIELQSVNRKHLEIHTQLPKELSCFEVDLRKWIGERIHRGNVTIRVTVVLNEDPPFVIRPNLPYLRQMLEAWVLLCAETGNVGSAFPLYQLFSDESLFVKERNFEHDSEHRNSLKVAISDTLEDLNLMREKEGEALHNDILQRLDHVVPSKELIGTRAVVATEKFRDALIARLQALATGTESYDERILKEVAIYAEKVDINEELIRLDSHLKQFRDILNSDAEAVGKTLEFLLQEMHREINTIGSKSSDIETSKRVVMIKGEFERIREQIQNIE